MKSPTENKDEQAVARYKGHMIAVTRYAAEKDWYIQVVAPDGTYAYDGWWDNSEDATAENAIAEAKLGALLDE